MDKPENMHINIVRLYQRHNEHQINIVWRYLLRHFSACKISLLRLIHKPWAALLTISVFGLMLALPLILQLGLHNLHTLSNQWDKGTRITLFLKQKTTIFQAQNLLKQLRHNPDIAKVQYISAEEGARELQTSFGNILNDLHDNPLPEVIVVDPKLLPDTGAITTLLANLEQLPEVDNAQLDMAWVKRLYYFIELGERLTLALFVIFALGIILVVNYISKTQLKSAQDEITILRWFGASNTWIRRPFLYSGMWCGFFGGLCALLLTQLFWWWLAEPINKLVHSYGNNFVWSGLTTPIAGIILLLSIILGWVGARIALRRYLNP